MVFATVFLFVFGLIIGSFINVIATRYSEKKPLFHSKNFSGRSKCPHCLKKLKWYELVPLFSFIVQKARCRSCGEKISWQYFLAELASGLIFLIPVYFYNPSFPAVYQTISSMLWIFIAQAFLLIWLIDYRLFVIPDELNIALVVLGLMLTGIQNKFILFDNFNGSFLGGYASVFGVRDNIWVNHLVGALAGIFIIGLIVFLTRGKGIGIGDLKLMGALGFIFGWPDALFILVFACVIGTIIGIYLIVTGRKKLKQAVPFAPFLILGTAVLVFLGEPIIGVYFRFFNLI
ncbi:MAG: leader peptidase (prepilin peptidase) / N-methyltransferase [Parcubacteria group bacterium Athens0714_26]|nr:MAG: leader peptidase (prepilin peptidase) / N-methyltransferase [Parcubacteria group bacterium Athens0714_26]